MKDLYVMIAADGMIHRNSVFYRYRVGQSAADKAAAKKVQIFSAKRGYLCEKWSLKNRDFCWRIAESLGVHYVQLHWYHINVVELAKYIDAFGYPPPKPPLSQAERMLIQIVTFLKPT